MTSSERVVQMRDEKTIVRFTWRGRARSDQEAAARAVDAARCVSLVTRLGEARLTPDVKPTSFYTNGESRWTIDASFLRRPGAVRTKDAVSKAARDATAALAGIAAVAVRIEGGGSSLYLGCDCRQDKMAGSSRKGHEVSCHWHTYLLREGDIASRRTESDADTITALNVIGFALAASSRSAKAWDVEHNLNVQAPTSATLRAILLRSADEEKALLRAKLAKAMKEIGAAEAVEGRFA